MVWCNLELLLDAAGEKSGMLNMNQECMTCGVLFAVNIYLDVSDIELHEINDEVFLKLCSW